MKIFILAAQENWITDQLAQEWIQHNKDLYTQNLQEADIIWILSNYVADAIPLEIYKQKKVITTIHHIVPWKTDLTKENHYKKLDSYTDVFLTNQEICKNTLRKYVKSPIKIMPLGINPNIYFNISDKKQLRNKFNIPENSFLIGSFQRDTEGDSIANKTYLPKLEKGPDIFIEAVKYYQDKLSNVTVLLTGRCRQYVMRELDKMNVPFIYHEMVDFDTLNEFYNCLDLYIVSSRVEGGPRAINECALAKVPIISTDMGIAKDILSKESIFNIDNLNMAQPNIDYAYNKAKEHIIPDHYKNFNKVFFDLLD